MVHPVARSYPGEHNRGGPLVTSKGRVIGIETLKKRIHKYESSGFAISIEVVLDAFDAIRFHVSSCCRRLDRPVGTMPDVSAKPVDNTTKTVVCKTCISFHISWLDDIPKGW